MPLAIVVYIDGSFVKHKIPVEPIYVTVHNLNLNLAVSGKAQPGSVRQSVRLEGAGYDTQPEKKHNP